jgi:hypothetical protein
MKKTTIFGIFSMLFYCLSIFSLSAQPYSNGGMSTGATSNSGVLAPNGYTWSEVQNQTGVTTVSNTLAGSGGAFNNANTSNFLLADDFVVPAGQTWDLTSVEVFGYQTGYAGTAIPIDQMRVQIFSGDPTLPASTVVFGSLVVNFGFEGFLPSLIFSIIFIVLIFLLLLWFLPVIYVFVIAIQHHLLLDSSKRIETLSNQPLVVPTNPSDPSPTPFETEINPELEQKKEAENKTSSKVKTKRKSA